MKVHSQAWRVFLPLILLLGGIVIVQLLPMGDWIAIFQKWMIEQGWIGAIWYAFAFALCGILLLPGGILGAGSGLVFGLWGGFFVIFLGNVIGTAGTIFLGRFFFRRFVERKMLSNPRWQTLDHALEREGRKVVFLSQLHPLFPTSLLHYLYGVTSIPFWQCLFWACIGKTPGLFLYVYLGTVGKRSLDIFRNPEGFAKGEFILWLAGLIAVLWITWILGRLAFRLLKEFHVNSPEVS